MTLTQHWHSDASIGHLLDAFGCVDREVPIARLRWSIAHLNDGSAATFARMQALGVALRGAEETPSRIEALRMYASGSAWFAHEDARRGTLARGKLADLAVLSKDYLGAPLEEMGAIHSLLTMVGGRVVYAEGAFAKLEEQR